MTWSWTSWLPAIRLRTSSAFGGGVAPMASSTARTEAIAWTVVHTPQIRCAQIQASRGSRPSTIFSIPRNIVPDAHASVTLPPDTSASIRKWPSIRVTGSILIRVTPTLRSCVRRLRRRRLRDAVLRGRFGGRCGSFGGRCTGFLGTGFLGARPGGLASTRRLQSLADTMRGHQGGDSHDQADADRLSGRVGTEPGHVGEPTVERARVRPEVVRRAADAGPAGLHRPAGPVVPAHVRTVVSSDRALAAHLVQAITLAVALIAPRLDEQPRVEVRAPLALVVDQVPVGEQRPVVLIERGHLVERQIMHEHGDRVHRVVRAPAEVHDRGAGHHVLHALPAGRAVLHNSSVPRAGAHREGELRVAGDLPREVERRATADRAEPVTGRDRALDHSDVLALEVAHGLRALCFGLLARAGHDQLVVIPRERLEHNLSDVRLRRAQDRLRVTGTVLELPPDQHRPAHRAERLRDRRAIARRQRQRRRHHATEGHERPPANATLLQPLRQGLIQEHLAHLSSTRPSALARPILASALPAPTFLFLDSRKRRRTGMK